jgi:hypothetical protein
MMVASHASFRADFSTLIQQRQARFQVAPDSSSIPQGIISLRAIGNGVRKAAPSWRHF